ncbi:MAG: hypothetical protein LAQ30_16545 [Acidobacteriia bacterium]|nr:hypothetical protein [Terriglobia bacterium]
MANPASYDDAKLILQLYELRRDEKLRKAREWFASHCLASSLEELMRLAPPASQENTYLRMVVGYWEMAASFVTSGVLNEDLFFQNNGELLLVWERIRPVLPDFRAFSKNPGSWRNLETVGNAFIRWMDANEGPEAYARFQETSRGVVTAKPAAAQMGTTATG